MLLLRYEVAVLPPLLLLLGVSGTGAVAGAAGDLDSDKRVAVSSGSSGSRWRLGGQQLDAARCCCWMVADDLDGGGTCNWQQQGRRCCLLPPVAVVAGAAAACRADEGDSAAPSLLAGSR